MLRHIRMTSKADPFRIPTKLFVTLRDNLRALYPLTIPHRTPVIGEPDPICRCPYPIYTLCTPEPSPYDVTTNVPTCTLVVGEPSATVPASAEGSPRSGDVPPLDVVDSASTPTQPSSPPQTEQQQSQPAQDPVSVAAADPTSRVSSSGVALSRTRPALRVQKLWRGRARPELHYPNVIPHHPTCYRCDICDGFQDVDEAGAEGGGSCGGGVATDVATAAAPAPAREAEDADAAVTDAPTDEACREGEEDADEEDEEAAEGEENFAGRPVSTDITNTIMDDTEVAALRYSDPFLVEVLGRPNTSAVSRRFTKQFMAQLSRCNLSAKDLAKKTRQLSRNAAHYSAVYNEWIQQQQQDKTQAARHRRGSRGSSPKGPSRVDYLSDKVELLDRASYAVRFAIAAYGLPYELGYFNSFADVMKVQAEPHRRYTCATSEEQMESMRRMLQGEKPDGLVEFAMSRYSIDVGKPCYSIVLDHGARRVVLTFRGTLTMADAVVDVTEGYAEVDLLSNGAKGVLGVEVGNARAAVPLEKLSAQKQRRYGDRGESNGMSERPGAATEGSATVLRTRVPLGFYEAVREAAELLVPDLQTIYSQYGSYELFITGHSLGAIEANLFHLLYCFPAGAAPVPFTKVQTYGFGSAPLVEEHVAAQLNALLAEEAARSGSRLVNFSYGKDCVARLHVRGILQALTENRSAAPPESPPGDTRPAGSLERRKHRSMASSAAGTPAEAIPDLLVLPQLTLPGLCYNIPHTLRRGCFAVPLDCPWRSQLILSVESVYHHFPIHYARALNRLLYYYTKRLVDMKACSSLSRRQ